MNDTTILTTSVGKDQFYPTPSELAAQMLEDVDWAYVGTVLEPSAGKGNLAYEIAKSYREYDRYGRRELDVDCVELDPNLRQICKYNFSEERIKLLREPHKNLDYMSHNQRTPEQEAERKRLKSEIDTLEAVSLHMVHDDFLTYGTFKHYDLIVMNPPFHDGDMHLLKALEMQKDGGAIVCLLNAETLRNPYTASRALLVRRLQEVNADIRFVENAFSHAERRTDVEIAIIKIHIPRKVHESTLYERMKKAKEAEYIPDPELQALVPGNYIDQAVRLYETEVAATMELVKEYHALAPYMASELGDKSLYGSSPILTLVIGHDSTYSSLDMNKYMRLVRLKYWRALFSNEAYIGKLTTNLRKTFTDNVDRMANYEFSAFNIKQVTVEMNAAMHQGVQDAIMELFAKLTYEHSWYPECSQNRHYYNGWKTNKAHKVGKKSIIPTNGIFSSYSWEKATFSVSNAYAVLSDIEKALDYLDCGRTTERRNLESFLKLAAETGQTRNVECTYFKVDFFKKGTTHIKFRPEAMPLVEKLNIYAAQKKSWLPPNYGKASYADLDREEQAAVDGFHGDGSEGSGKTAYAEVLKDSAYYLSESTQAIPALIAPAT